MLHEGSFVDECYTLMSFETCCPVLAPPWLLPVERPIGRLGFAPTGDRRLSRRTEFPERPGCAIKGMSLETDGKPCLNGGLLTSVTR